MVCVILLQAIRAFFLVRDLSLSLMHEPETQLPLTKEENCIKVNDVLDLSQYTCYLP
jgi:protein CLEC16A